MHFLIAFPSIKRCISGSACAFSEISSLLIFTDMCIVPRTLRRKLHQTIAKVTDVLDGKFAFNTAISAIMDTFFILAEPLPKFFGYMRNKRR